MKVRHSLGQAVARVELDAWLVGVHLQSASGWLVLGSANNDVSLISS